MDLHQLNPLREVVDLELDEFIGASTLLQVDGKLGSDAV
jgi:hypothetical protein